VPGSISVDGSKAFIGLKRVKNAMRGRKPLSVGGTVDATMALDE
jgi:hypothetical protein